VNIFLIDTLAPTLKIFLINPPTEWNITNKINFVISDNTANVQKALQDLGWKHFGCYGHTLNLILQHVLTTVEDTLDKVKTIARFFNKSPQATEKLLKYQKIENDSTTIPLKLIVNCHSPMETIRFSECVPLPAGFYHCPRREQHFIIYMMGINGISHCNTEAWIRAMNFHPLEALLDGLLPEHGYMVDDGAAIARSSQIVWASDTSIAAICCWLLWMIWGMSLMLMMLHRWGNSSDYFNK
jgi:hypothetical protein